MKHYTLQQNMGIMPRNKSARETKTVDAGADSRFTIGGGSIFGAPRATIRQPLLRQLLEEPLQLHNQLIAETPPCGHTTLAMAKASSSTPRPSSAQPYHSAHVLRRNQVWPSDRAPMTPRSHPK